MPRSNERDAKKLETGHPHANNCYRAVQAPLKTQNLDIARGALVLVVHDFVSGVMHNATGAVWGIVMSGGL
jgi:hypothetical protein